MKKKQITGEQAHPSCPSCGGGFTYEYSKTPKKFHCIDCGIDFRTD